MTTKLVNIWRKKSYNLNKFHVYTYIIENTFKLIYIYIKYSNFFHLSTYILLLPNPNLLWQLLQL